MSASSPSSEVASNYSQSEAKRRRLRKGTHSCWQCKRRKMKCIFDIISEATTCNGCRQRGFKCVSQEFPEDASLDGAARVERLQSLTDKSIYDRRTPATPNEDSGTVGNGIPTPASMISEPLAFYESSEVCLSDSDIVMSVPDSFVSIILQRMRFFPLQKANIRDCLGSCTMRYHHEKIQSRFAQPAVTLLSLPMK